MVTQPDLTKTNNPLNPVNLRTISPNLAVDIVNKTLIYSPEYEAILQNVSQTIAKAETLLAQPIDDLDDDALETLRKELDVCVNDVKIVGTTRDDLKRFMKTTTEGVLSIFDDHAKSLGYDKIGAIQAQRADIRSKQLSNRKEKRWNELEKVFQADLQLYPNIRQYTPRLTDFSDFKLKNPKLVTGDKSKNIGKNQKAVVSQYLHTIDELITAWLQNQLNLGSIYHNQLLSIIVENPDQAVFYERQTALKQQEEADEKVRQEQKRLKKEREEAQKQAKIDAQTTQPMIPQQPVSPVLQQQTPTKTYGELTREWLANYVLTASPTYDDVAQSAHTRVLLIHDIMHQLDNPHSSFLQWVHQYKVDYNQDELILNTIQQITSL